MIIQRICSGGQTGADIAGLKVAKAHNVPTGGYIPKRFITQAGPKPEYAELYGLQEHPSPKYPGRTFLNAKESDGTMRFAANWNSPGEILTLKAINQYKKPYFDVDLINLDPKSIIKAIKWLQANDIKVLNIAGNSERTHPKTEMKVTAYLEHLFFTIEVVNEGTKLLAQQINDEIDQEILAEIRAEKEPQ